MAKEKSPEEAATAAERQKLQDEKKQLKRQQKEQKKEAKMRAKEIAKQEDALMEEEGEGNGLVTFGATLLIVALWIAVICVIIKLDVGGFGSSVLTPILKDVPLVNRILPGNSLTETTNPENYGGYTNLKDAAEDIKKLELDLEQALNAVKAKNDEIDTLKAEIIRLQEFEQKQAEFQRIRTEFYEEVVYAEKGPGAAEFRKYYETMDPTTAQYIYKQVVTQLEESKEIQDFAATFSQMKPKEAAKIFEEMTDSLNVVARTLKVMSAESRGSIMGAMDPAVAAKLTKIMDPES